MPKVTTFTANLLAETTYFFGDWKPNRTQRSDREFFQVGGKGINVCKMLNRLGAYSEALCFPGGAFGPMCIDWMETKNIRLKTFAEGCETRSGSVINSQRSGETTFLGIESFVSAEAIQQCVDYLKDNTNHFLLAICGSIPAWNEERYTPLREFIANRKVECHLVVDTYGPSLHGLLEMKPELIKINRDELESLFGETDKHRSTDDLLSEAASSRECPRWAVTDGGEPVWIWEKGGDPIRIDPPETICVSPTGCGDIFFATMLDALYNRKDYTFEQAAIKAADYASRSAALPTIAEFAMD